MIGFGWEAKRILCGFAESRLAKENFEFAQGTDARMGTDAPVARLDGERAVSFANGKRAITATARSRRR